MRFIVLIPGAIFLQAGITKLADIHTFAGALTAYEVLPSALVLPASYVLAALEVFLGVCLCGGVERVFSVRLGQGLLGLYVAVLSIKLIQGKNIPCGCIGTHDLISWSLVARDMGLILLLEAALGASRLAPSAQDTPAVRRAGLVVSAACVTFGLVVASPALARVLAPPPVLVGSGPAIDDSGPLPGDQVSFGKSRSERPGDTLVAFVGNDVLSVYLQAGLDAGELAQAVDDVVVVASTSEFAFRVSAPGLLLLDRAGKVVFRWQPLGLWSWHDLASQLARLQASNLESSWGSVGLRLGDPMPALALHDSTGRPVRLEFAGDRDYLVFFIDLNCSMCPVVNAWLREIRGRLPGPYECIVVVTGATDEDTRGEVMRALESPVLRERLGVSGVSILRSAWLPFTISDSIWKAQQLGLDSGYYLDLDNIQAGRLALHHTPSLLVVKHGHLAGSYNIDISRKPVEIDLFDALFEPPVD